MASKQPIILTDEIVPPPALIRAGLDALPSIIRAQGERASRRFIEFFTANIRNRHTRMAYARAAKQFFDLTHDCNLPLTPSIPLRRVSNVAPVSSISSRHRCRDRFVRVSLLSHSVGG